METADPTACAAVDGTVQILTSTEEPPHTENGHATQRPAEAEISVQKADEGNGTKDQKTVKGAKLLSKESSEEIVDELSRINEILEEILASIHKLAGFLTTVANLATNSMPLHANKAYPPIPAMYANAMPK